VITAGSDAQSRRSRRCHVAGVLSEKKHDPASTDSASESHPRRRLPRPGRRSDRRQLVADRAQCGGEWRDGRGGAGAEPDARRQHDALPPRPLRQHTRAGLRVDRVFQLRVEGLAWYTVQQCMAQWNLCRPTQALQHTS